MGHSIPQFDTSEPKVKRVFFYVGLVFVIIAAIVIITLLFFGGAVTHHKKAKELSPSAYELRNLHQYEDRQLKDINKAIKEVVRDYR